MSWQGYDKALKIARGGFVGTGNQTITFDEVMTEIVIYNNSPSQSLTFKASTFEYILPPGGVFNDRIVPFTSLTITTTNGDYHGYGRYLRY